MDSTFRKRIEFYGNISDISSIVCREFDLGELISYKPVPIGYEDFNYIIQTHNDKYFVKIFAAGRTDEECQRNVEVLLKVIGNGIATPKLIKSTQGYLLQLKIDEIALRICVMEYIDGEDLYSSKFPISEKDIQSIAQQASLINSLDLRPVAIENRSSIINFLREFQLKGQYLEVEDLKLIQPLVEKYKEINFKRLPLGFIHGDLIKTNIIRDETGNIWIVDFSVSNYSYRILEIALLACDILFDKDNKIDSNTKLDFALTEYQKLNKISDLEFEALPIFIKVAHAMHVLCANYEKKYNKVISDENEYFLNIGKSGLRQTN